MADIVNKGDVKKIVIGNNSYTIYDESARAAAANAQSAADGKVDAQYVTTQLASYVTTTTANATYAKADDLTKVGTNVSALTTKVGELTAATNPSFKSVKYDSAGHKITFGTVDGKTVDLDAAPFIKDGMLTNAEVKNATIEESTSGGQTSQVTKLCLVLTVKIDNGDGTVENQVLNIPIEQIFNANNYYTKSEITTNYYDKNGVEDYVDKTVDAAVEDIPTNDNVKTWISTAKTEAVNEAKAAIPTNVSALTNDAGYLTTCFVSYDASEKVLTLK